MILPQIVNIFLGNGAKFESIVPVITSQCSAKWNEQTLNSLNRVPSRSKVNYTNKNSGPTMQVAVNMPRINMLSSVLVRKTQTKLGPAFRPARRKFFHK